MGDPIWPRYDQGCPVSTVFRPLSFRTPISKGIDCPAQPNSKLHIILILFYSLSLRCLESDNVFWSSGAVEPFGLEQFFFNCLGNGTDLRHAFQ